VPGYFRFMSKDEFNCFEVTLQRGVDDPLDNRLQNKDFPRASILFNPNFLPQAFAQQCEHLGHGF